MGTGERAHGRDNLAHVDELRERLGRQERADLEAAYAGGIFVTDPAPLGIGGRKGLHQLQAVAQAHLAQHHAIPRIDFLNVGHARFLSALAVSFSSSARTAAVSAPSGATFSPSPIW